MLFINTKKGAYEMKKQMVNVEVNDKLVNDAISKYGGILGDYASMIGQKVFKTNPMKAMVLSMFFLDFYDTFIYGKNINFKDQETVSMLLNELSKVCKMKEINLKGNKLNRAVRDLLACTEKMYNL